MSQPKAPYYHKVGKDVYHWEKCSNNHYPGEGWEKTNTKPSGKEQCNLCKTK